MNNSIRSFFALFLVLAILCSVLPAAFAFEKQDLLSSRPADLPSIRFSVIQPADSTLSRADLTIHTDFIASYKRGEVLLAFSDRPCFTYRVRVYDDRTGKQLLMKRGVGMVENNMPMDTKHDYMTLPSVIHLDTRYLATDTILVSAELTIYGGEEDPAVFVGTCTAVYHLSGQATGSDS